MFACIHAPQAAALADSFSPHVEMIDETTAVFSITQRQLERIPPQTQMAVAATVETAILAARNLPGYTFIPPGDEQRLLGHLPIDALPPDPQLFQTLDLWGIHSLADLAKLPDEGLSDRLGPRGLWLQKLARGVLSRPLRPLLPEPIYEESAEFDHPIEQREPLLFLLGRFLYDLTAKLRSQFLSAGVLHITLGPHTRALSLPFPTRDIKFLLKLIEHSLERHPPTQAIDRVALRIDPVQPRRVQHDLFTLAAPEPEKLELTLGKIRALVGPDNVLYPQLRDTHRPGAGLNDAPPLAFRYFRPPLEARVDPQPGKLLWTRQFQGRILNIAGPWRSSGDWWQSDPWNRDEWDLLLSDGALYRLVQNHLAHQWLVEGTYD